MSHTAPKQKPDLRDVLELLSDARPEAFHSMRAEIVLVGPSSHGGTPTRIRSRHWWQAPDCSRIEHGDAVHVVRGRHRWSYSPSRGATADILTATPAASPFRVYFQTRELLAADIEGVGSDLVGGREAVLVRLRMPDGFDPGAAAASYGLVAVARGSTTEVTLDCETGLILRYHSAALGGFEFVGLAVDEELDQSQFERPFPPDVVVGEPRLPDHLSGLDELRDRVRGPLYLPSQLPRRAKLQSVSLSEFEHCWHVELTYRAGPAGCWLISIAQGPSVATGGMGPMVLEEVGDTELHVITGPHGSEASAARFDASHPLVVRMRGPGAIADAATRIAVNLELSEVPR